jgi:hypothetical protein
MKALIEMSEFIRTVKALKPFTGEDSKYIKPNLMKFIYITFDLDTQEARFEALDGHRIAIEYVKCTTDESFAIYIEPFNPWKTNSQYAEVKLINKLATVDMGYYSLRFIQPEEKWYDTGKIIKDTEQIDLSSKMAFNPDFMIDALKGINNYGLRKISIIETRGKKDPIIIRETKDKRNMRYILPMNFNDEED